MRRKRHPFLFLAGYRVLSTKKSDIAKAIDLCRAERISYRDVIFGEDRASFIVPFLSSFRLLRRAEAVGISIDIECSCGIPAVLMRYRHRYGLFAGLVASFALMILAGSVVWDVRIDGEKKLSENEVRELLSECGLSVGTRIDRIDADVLQNRVLIASDEISWISINLIGCVAEVEIREIDFAEREESLGEAVNIVAKQGGRIVSIEDIRGNIAVEIGEEVSEGQLLIGGVYGDEENGFRYTEAKGRVLAKIERVFEVRVERKDKQKVYTGEVKCEKYLVFFEKKIKIFANYRNLDASYDKIEIEEIMSAPGGSDLPIKIVEIRYLEYEEKEVERSDAQMRDLADLRMRAQIERELGGAELLRKSTEAELSEDCLILRCKLRCIDNIAKAVPIGIK